MSPARKAGLCSQITDIDTSLAGTNRSGTVRLPELAGSETTASNSLAGGTADCQVATGGGERHPSDLQVVETDQLLVNSEQGRTMTASEAAAAAAAAALAGRPSGGRQ